MALGKTIRALRESRGLTLEQLADASGVELGTISALENRDSQRTKFAGRLASALGVTMEELANDDRAVSLASVARQEAPRTLRDWPFSVSLSSIERLRAEDKQTLDKTLTAFVAGTLARYKSEEMKRNKYVIQSNELKAQGDNMATLDAEIEATEAVAQGSESHGHAKRANSRRGGHR